MYIEFLGSEYCKHIENSPCTLDSVTKLATFLVCTQLYNLNERKATNTLGSC